MVKFYLIPSLLHDSNTGVIPPQAAAALQVCTAIYAENLRTTRRFVKKILPQFVIDDAEWFEIGKAESECVAGFRQAVQHHQNIALISEAGCPAIADPGYLLVAEAHGTKGVEVVPIAGPSSILLALMASGLGGQRFAFHGYLPVEQNARRQALQKIWQRAKDDEATQLFMETPYRNNSLLEDLLKTIPSQAKLCIAANLTAQDEYVQMKTVAAWLQNPLPNLHKQPCIFALAQ